MLALNSGTILARTDNFEIEVTSMFGETARRDEFGLSDFLNTDGMNSWTEAAGTFLIENQLSDDNTDHHQLNPSQPMIENAGHFPSEDVTPVSSTSSGCFPPSAINPKDLEMPRGSAEVQLSDREHHEQAFTPALTHIADNASYSKAPATSIIDTWLFRVVAKCLQGEEMI
jgi:hypothetical protein